MTVRVDVWMWSVRLFRTRTAANNACSRGQVRVNDVVAKPSRAVHPGDTIVARAGGRQRIVEVVETHSKRVGAAVAAEAFIDSSPPPPTRKAPPTAQAVRDPGAGRPTKRDRRQIDKFRTQHEQDNP